ncbi:MAG: NAD(P)H-quinone oxidoreductase, partial [Dehalococcoidia bacterium]|nr:NAD(P)H-quinone oxidoreductase [Dehalococcoidia bacterium]
MKAIVITKPGGPEVLQLMEVPEPVAGPEDLLVRVHATALNRADIL